MLTDKESFKTNLLKSIFAALLCLSLWAFAGSFILAFIDVAFDPVPPSPGRSEDEGALLMAVFCFVAFWGAGLIGLLINRGLNVSPITNEDGSIVPLTSNSTLVGWLVASAFFLLAAYTLG